MNSAIYAIRNSVNGFQYVGSAVNRTKRWEEHRRLLRAGRHENSRLQNAWTKYGEASFAFLILERVADLAGLIAREQFWIDETRAADRGFGYNICPTAGSRLGTMHTPATRARMSAAGKGRVLSEEHRRKIGTSHIGKKLSAAARAKISVAHCGTKLSLDHRTKISEGLCGRIYSAETREKMSRWERPETLRRAISVALTGKAKSPGHRAKLSAVLMGRKIGPQSPETIAKRVAATKLTKAVAPCR
jgi:group I intron endonuclease